MHLSISAAIKNAGERKIMWFLFSGTLLMRVSYAVIFYVTHDPPATNAYYEIALKILEQGKVFYDTGNPYYESAGPLLPWMNALTMLVAGKNYLGLYLVTAVASSLVTLYTYKLSRLIFEKGISILAGAWSAFYIFYFYYTPAPGKDIWMAFFMVFLLYMMLKLFRKKEFSYSGFAVLTIMYVLSFHLDERYFVFFPFLFLYILISETEFFKKFRIIKASLFALLVIILMIPWTVRNCRTHGRIVLISTRTEVFTDRIFGYEPGEHFLDDAIKTDGEYFIRDYQIDSVKNGLKTITDGGRKISSEMVQAIKDGNLPAPLTGIRASVSRLVTMFEPFQLKGRYERTGYFYYKKSLKHNVATFLFYGVMFLFSIPGFYFMYKKDKHTALLFISVIIIYALIHALAIPYTNWRYRLPLDALFIITGSCGIINTAKLLECGFSFKNTFQKNQ